jgi:hypothetical protein
MAKSLKNLNAEHVPSEIKTLTANVQQCSPETGLPVQVRVQTLARIQHTGFLAEAPYRCEPVLGAAR